MNLPILASKNKSMIIFFGLQIYKLIERATRNFADGYVISGQKVYEDLLNARILSSKTSTRLINPPLSNIPRNVFPKGKFPGLTIGWLARIAPIKRFDRVLELARKFPNHAFWIGGDFEMSEKDFRDLPVNVIMHGWVNSHEFGPNVISHFAPRIMKHNQFLFWRQLPTEYQL